MSCADRRMKPTRALQRQLWIKAVGTEVATAAALPDGALKIAATYLIAKLMRRKWKTRSPNTVDRNRNPRHSCPPVPRFCALALLRPGYRSEDKSRHFGVAVQQAACTRWSDKSVDHAVGKREERCRLTSSTGRSPTPGACWPTLRLSHKSQSIVTFSVG